MKRDDGTAAAVHQGAARKVNGEYRHQWERIVEHVGNCPACAGEFSPCHTREVLMHRLGVARVAFRNLHGWTRGEGGAL